MVTTALGVSRLWATVGQGIVNEVYWPDTGSPQIRDLGFIVADDAGWWIEVKQQDRYEISIPQPYLPLPTVVREGERYRLVLEFLPDPLRDVLLIRYRLEGEGLLLYPLLASHLAETGSDNDAWVGEGLFAYSREHALCLLAERDFLRKSAGYFGRSDGWQDFKKHNRMSWDFDQAKGGNVSLMGELEGGEGVLALAFADSPEDAHTLAASSLEEGYDSIRPRFVEGWESWRNGLNLGPRAPAASTRVREMAYRSAMVLKVHADRTYPGATVASLSIPWGETRNDPYHFVWPRDAVETGFGLIAIGEFESARRLLSYLATNQLADGHWQQNFFPDGRPRWKAVQLDQVGLPILLAAKLRELNQLGGLDVREMVQRAAEYIMGNGPATPQDRWEENEGYSPFTIAVEIAALVAATDWLDPAAVGPALDLARSWNEQIEKWTYVEDTALAREHDVKGYYVRIAPSAGGLSGPLTIANRGGLQVRAEDIVALDFLYLARLGLRRVEDERIQNTLKVVDGELKVDTPNGPAYHRYQHDGYGEHDTGGPYDGSGIGRAWPLLAGERGHAELLQGRDRTPYLEAMAQMTGRGGLIPEQVWDTDPIPARGLYPGRPTGSAMPLVWAHAEFLKLLLAPDKRPLELLEIVEKHFP